MRSIEEGAKEESFFAKLRALRAFAVSAGALLLVVSFAIADEAPRLRAERDTLLRQLDEVAADQLEHNPGGLPVLQQLVRVDSQLAGTADDPLLSNEAIQANRVHRLYLKVLAGRAERAKAGEAQLRQNLPPDPKAKQMLESANAKVAAADVALAEANAKAEESEAAYLKAIAGYEAAAADLKSLLPPPPPQPVDPLAAIPRQGAVLLPTEAQLLAAGPALNGRPVRVGLKITAMSRPFADAGTTEFATEDGKVHATMHWDQSPPLIKKLFAQRSTGKNAMSVDSRLWVTGTFDGLQVPGQCTIIVVDVQKRD